MGSAHVANRFLSSQKLGLFVPCLAALAAPLFAIMDDPFNSHDVVVAAGTVTDFLWEEDEILRGIDRDSCREILLWCRCRC